MSDVFVNVDKRDALELRLAKLGVRDADLIEKFILGSGSGGQKINKTSSCVYLKHIPTGIEIKCQQGRSRELNRFIARRELCERLTERIEGARSKRQQEMEKIRRQKRRRSRRQKERMLNDKKHHGDKKRQRSGSGFLALALSLCLAGSAFGANGGGDAPSALGVTYTVSEVTTLAPPMSVSQALLLGVVEGITEFLPVSSTGHLLLAQRWMGLGEGPGADAKDAADAYAICIQAGAILAVAGLYAGRLWGIARGVFGANPAGLRLGINIVAGFLPAAVLGLALEGLIKHWLFGDGRWGLWPIVMAWFVGGVVILVMEALRNRSTVNVERVRMSKPLESLTWRMALVIGLIQCLAMWPGVSRSLATILGGVATGLTLPAAVEFSFLLGLVTLSASTAVDLLKHGDTMLTLYGVGTPVFGLLVALVSATIAIKWMVGYLQRHGMAMFGYYRIALALVVAVTLLWRG
ncbi:MAG: hypothetical protein K8T26_13425 [Lentisphaerae bacterium]|nr:hypothetical protein [Lentisphaerota bacterium]